MDHGACDCCTAAVCAAQVRLLREAGILVALDMHSLWKDGNAGTWCGDAEPRCDVTDTSHFMFRAWRILAERLCAEPNVLFADVFNEPYDHSWDGWARFVEAIGAHILHYCPRWLIVAEGVGGGGYWWGEVRHTHEGRLRADRPRAYPIPQPYAVVACAARV